MSYCTVQDVFDIAVYLMDAQNDYTGSTDNANTKDHRLRTPALLNSILDRVFPASDTFPDTSDGVRPVCPKVSAMSDPILLDERLCCGVLPYGLAALLLTEEDAARADFFWQTFREQLEEARRSIPASISSVEDVYGTVSHELNQFSMWP